MTPEAVRSKIRNENLKNATRLQPPFPAAVQDNADLQTCRPLLAVYLISVRAMAEPSAAPLAEASRAKLEAEPETDQQEEGTNDAVRRKKQDRARTALKALESPRELSRAVESCRDWRDPLSPNGSRTDHLAVGSREEKPLRYASTAVSDQRTGDLCRLSLSCGTGPAEHGSGTRCESTRIG